MKCNMKRKGFTLVELLIVIVVIGILSAMMMLSSTEAVTSAQASNIVSNLRNLKTAALAYYVDNLDSATTVLGSAQAKDSSSTEFQTLIKYLNTGSGTDNSSYTGYGIINNASGWYVYCSVTDTRVREKLKGRAKSVGLCGADQATGLTTGNVYGGTGIGTPTNAAVAGMWVVDPDGTTDNNSSNNNNNNP